MASEVVCGLVFRLLLPICLAVGECFPLSEGPGWEGAPGEGAGFRANPDHQLECPRPGSGSQLRGLGAEARHFQFSLWGARTGSV